MEPSLLSISERLKFDPACPRAWKSNGDLVIGFTDCETSKPILISQYQKEIGVWIGLLDGSRNLDDLLLTGSAMGLSHTQLRELLSEFIAAGHVYAVENVPVPSKSPHLATNLRCDARLAGISAQQLLQKRKSLQVLVEGSGQAAFSLVSALSDVQLTVGWRPMNRCRIRAEEVPRNLDVNEFVNQKWSQVAKPLPNPNVVFSLNESHDFLELESSYSDALVIPITVHSRRIAIGPILGAHKSECAACLHESRKLQDNDWALLTVQALHQKRALPIISERWLSSLVATCVNLVLEFADSSRILDLTKSSLELTPPNPVWQSRMWNGRLKSACNHNRNFQSA